MSDQTDDADLDELHGWQPSDRACEDCGSPAEVGTWWDDLPENGGAAIGSMWRCTDAGCGWADWA